MDTSSRSGSRAFRVALMFACGLLPCLPQSFATSPTAGASVIPPYFLHFSSGLYRPSNATFYLKKDNGSGFADVAITYGIPGDRPLTGDWDGDRIDTIGVYRNGVFYLHNSNTSGFADRVVPFGRPGDLPVVGDWDGDGIDTIGVYRNGVFFLRNANTPGPPDLVFAFGLPGDIPITGDWTGKAFDSVGVYRPSDSTLLLEGYQYGRLRRRGTPVWDTRRSAGGGRLGQQRSGRRRCLSGE